MNAQILTEEQVDIICFMQQFGFSVNKLKYWQFLLSFKS